MTTPKCPKCNSSPDCYRELASASYRFNLENNKFLEAPYIHKTVWQQTGFDFNGTKIDCELEEIDNTGEILAECGECGHLWKLRKFKSIDKLIEIHGFCETKKPQEK